MVLGSLVKDENLGILTLVKAGENKDRSVCLGEGGMHVLFLPNRKNSIDKGTEVRK